VIICGDVTAMPVRGKFHAVLCDPPYALTNRTYDYPHHNGLRKERGFMGKAWDNGVAFNPDTWAAILDLLHPGAFGMAFGGSRTYHRLACAIEDAGAELHPMIYGWAFGSGFPKATRIDTQIDKAAGAEREKLASRPGARNGNGQNVDYGSFASKDGDFSPTTPATPLARAWAGHRYGKQALKPAVEPICCFQRPYQGRPVDCITETGAGSLWIEGGRVETVEIAAEGGVKNPHPSQGRYGDFAGNVRRTKGSGASSAGGRWPANFILQHLPECGDSCAPSCPVRKLDASQVDSPVLPCYNVEKQEAQPCGDNRANKGVGIESGDCREAASNTSSLKIGGSGNKPTDRFQTSMTFTTLMETIPTTSCLTCKSCQGQSTTPTINASEKITGFDVMEQKSANVSDVGSTSSWQSSIDGKPEPIRATAKNARWDTRENGESKIHTITATTCASGQSKAGPSRFFQQVGWQLDHAEPVRYQAKAGRRERNAGFEGRCIHPTLKPIALAKYLATLLLPPPEYAPRRLLIPFGGVGSEAIGAILAGWEEVVIIEQSFEYCQIGAARIKWWQERMQQTGATDVKVILVPAKERSPLQPVLL